MQHRTKLKMSKSDFTEFMGKVFIKFLPVANFLEVNRYADIHLSETLLWHIDVDFVQLVLSETDYQVQMGIIYHIDFQNSYPRCWTSETSVELSGHVLMITVVWLFNPYPKSKWFSSSCSRWAVCFKLNAEIDWYGINNWSLN